MTQPALRWNAGLERSGLQFRNHLQIETYPPEPPLSTYIRTGSTAHKAGFTITEVGRSMDFGSTSYLKYLLMPARTVENWRGKREELIGAMSAGFKEGIKDYTE